MAELFHPEYLLSGLRPVYLTLLLVIFLVGLVVVRAWWSPLRHVPGPGLARFCRLWKLMEYYNGSFEKTNIELHKKYGPIVRIAPDEYSIDDPEAAKVIYAHGSNFPKSAWYYAARVPPPYDKDLFSATDIPTHAALRRKVAASYSMTSLVKMERLVDESSALFIQQLREISKSGLTVNMTQWLQFFAFDVIGQLTCGKRFGFIEAGYDVGGVLGAIHKGLTFFTTVGVYHEWYQLCVRVLTAFGGGNYVVDFTHAQIKERQQMGQSPLELEGGADFLGKLLALHEKDPKGFTEADVFVGSITNIGAGSDTTSISLSAVLYNLCRYPEVLQTLRRELEARRAEGKLSDPITFKQSQECPYLQAVIKEALRMHPATGLPLLRVVPKGGVVLANTFFPEGTTVGINSWVAHANKDVFGEDADAFRPERWLVSKEEYNRLDRYYFTFGMGARTCIGKNISLMEISKLIPKLVLEFDLELSNPDEKLKNHNVWFVKQANFSCSVHVRST